MKLKYYRQSCFTIEIAGKHIMFDPFINGGDAAPDKTFDVKDIKVDYILLSHGHGDHVADVESVAAHNEGVKIISNYEIVEYYGAKGIKGHPLNHGGKWTFDFGTVRYVNAVHSSVLPDGTYAGNPGGFVIESEEGTFYFAGDTALTWDMKLIPMTCKKLDFAILPVGDNFTMGYEDAVIASDFIECDTIIGCHFDTFGYIVIDHDAALKAFEDKGKTLILPNVGDEINL